MKRILIFLLLFGSMHRTEGQRGHTIDLNEIPQKKVRKYIHDRDLDKMEDFSGLHASWVKGDDASRFHVMSGVFVIRNSLASVWEHYRNAVMTHVWKGRSAGLGLMISKRSNSVRYADEKDFPSLDTGQVYFVNLRLMQGLVSVPVAFEITTIDPTRKIIEFSYLDDNISRGKQTLIFTDNGDGFTRIVHSSYFRSKSKLRDALIYPFFHRRIVSRFHRNMSHDAFVLTAGIE
jgi:hypothetical protein